MIITRTPFRVSFVGGGTDLGVFYRENGYGAVVSTAIQQYMYIVIHPYFHDKIRIKYSRTEDVDTVDAIEHPVVRECLKRIGIGTGIEIASFADIPAGTGLGSSSSFTVGLLNALYAYTGKVVSKARLAEEACEIEIDILKEPIGKQDQYAAAFGGVNYIRFNRDETVDVAPILLTEPALRDIERNLRLYYIGGEHKAGDILKQQKRNLSEDRKKFDHMVKMLNLADELNDEMNSQQVKEIGTKLHQGWTFKKQLATGISNPVIDELYEKALAGGGGGKLLGAGGAGFLLLWHEDHEYLSRQLGRKTLPLKIDREGAKIIFYE